MLAVQIAVKLQEAKDMTRAHLGNMVGPRETPLPGLYRMLDS